MPIHCAGSGAHRSPPQSNRLQMGTIGKNIIEQTVLVLSERERIKR
jgi:hypothetical protein